MDDPVIAILTALKTGWQFLPEAAASVRGQRFTRWQWLIGLNGHAPDSAAHHVARAVAVDDPRIEVLDLPGCRNKPQTLHAMLAATDAKLVAILDADDLWEPEKLAAQMEAWHAGLDVLGTAGSWFGTSEGPIAVKAGPVTFDHLLACNHVVSSSVLMRRDCCQWPDTDGLDDYPLWLDLARRGRTIENLPDQFVKIRCHPGQHFAGRLDDSEAIRAQFAALLHA